MLSPLIKSYSELESLHKMDSYRECFSTQLHLETILLKKRETCFTFFEKISGMSKL